MKSETLSVSEKKVFSLLSLAAKAGFIDSGEFSTEKSVKEGKAKLVILASDASDNTKKKFKNISEFRGVRMVEFGRKDKLGHAIGKEFRASLSIRDDGMAQAVLKHIDEINDKF